MDYFEQHIVNKKNRKKSSIKGLTKGSVVIFSFLITLGTQIRLNGDLFTDSFLSALGSFISRKAPDLKMAHSNLNPCIKQLDQTKLLNLSNRRNIEKIFSPPSSPSMEGVRGSSVQSVKTGLKTIV